MWAKALWSVVELFWQWKPFEGTNTMLKRAGTFGAKNCLFVKLGKPKQDTRFDVPVFGVQTLQTMHDAGIGNAALESDLCFAFR